MGATAFPRVGSAVKPESASTRANPQNAVTLVNEYPVRIHDEPTRNRASPLRCWANGAVPWATPTLRSASVSVVRATMINGTAAGIMPRSAKHTHRTSS